MLSLKIRDINIKRIKGGDFYGKSNKNAKLTKLVSRCFENRHCETVNRTKERPAYCIKITEICGVANIP